jgi:hypothetical protein
MPSHSNHERLRFHFILVDVTPHPVFTAFQRLDNRVAGGAEMLGRVLVPRCIATAHVAACFAQAQMHPGVSGLQTFFAAFGFGLYVVNLVQMSTGRQN